MAAATALLFFASVLAHELSHSVVAVRNGIPVHRITLFVFGGVSHLAHEARHFRLEFIVAVAGPLCSLALSALFAGLWYFLDDVIPGLGSVLLVLASVNLSLALFNMLPGFPLDGGRALRAALWGLTGSFWRATQVAALGGILLGAVMTLGGVAMLLLLSGFQGAWLSLVGLFLLSAAATTYRQERFREQLKGHRVSEVMSTGWLELPWETPLQSMTHGRETSGRERMVAVVAEDSVVGIATRVSMERAAKLQGRDATLADAAIPIGSVSQVSPDDNLAEVLESMENLDISAMIVVDNGMLAGVVTSREIRLLEKRGLGGGFFRRRK